MPLRKLVRTAREAWEVPRDLLLGRYPDFVTGGGLAKGHVPVFVFHSIEPRSFAAKLAYLADNGYVALSADEHFQILMNARPAPDKAVVVTLDDGRASVYSVAYPLLSRYGMKAVVFLVPEKITDAPARKISLQTPLQRLPEPQRNEAFLSWEEVGALAGSG